jgi:predicted amidohydrolase
MEGEALRVAVIQMEVDGESRANNQRRAFELIAKAAETDPVPEVICLPGRCEGGSLVEEENAASAVTSRTFTEVLASQAREMGVSVVVGFAEFDGQHQYDCAAWLDADGDMLVKHRRIIVGRDESRHFGRGRSIQVALSLFGPVGVLVGDDVCNDAIVATVQQMGAPVVFVCGCWAVPPKEQLLCKLARAHGVWLVIADSGGPGGGRGHSRIIDPQGTVACAADRAGRF